MELHEKMEIDTKNRSGSEDSHRSIYDKSNNSLMESIYHVKNPVAEKKQVSDFIFLLFILSFSYKKTIFLN